MPNRNYRAGRAREYEAMEILRSEGWLANRSAGSHGAWDVAAAKDGRVLFVQVKKDSAKAKPEEIKELIHWAEEGLADAEIWTFRYRKGVERKRIVSVHM